MRTFLMTTEELKDLYFNELFEEWNNQRDMFDKQDMYRQFARFLTDKMFVTNHIKEFEEVGL